MMIHTLSTIAREYRVTKARAWQWLKEGRLPGGELGADGRMYWKELPMRPEVHKRGKKRQF